MAHLVGYCMSQDLRVAGNALLGILCNGDETAIWRYMDLPKFVAMLASNTLWFAKAGAGDHGRGAADPE